jgi:hypothetical protein
MSSPGTSAIPEPAAIDARLVSVQPNPMTQSATIAFRLERPGSVRLGISDAAGREVTVIERLLQGGEQVVESNTSALPAGVYFYRLVTDGYTAAGSVVVVRKTSSVRCKCDSLVFPVSVAGKGVSCSEQYTPFPCTHPSP